MIEFKGVKLEVKLEQQTPLLHFQYSAEREATLRASEVKPKFDRFLIEKVGEEQLKPFFTTERALNYKMKFLSDGLKFEEKDTPLYFAKKSKPVYVNLKLIILCFIPELQELIEKYLEEFFIVTNFGTRQGKGYGSFVVIDDSGINQKNIRQILINYFSLDVLYAIKFERKSNPLEIIGDFYTLTKSGINDGRGYQRSSLFQYMHKKGIDNEKAELKQQGIVKPFGQFNKYNYQKNKNPYYVRAVLGVAPILNFKNDKVTIISQDKGIERFPSPLYFKVIDDFIYIIPKQIDERIFGKTFTFENKSSRDTIRLKTLEKFDLKEFLDDAVLKYNNSKLNFSKPKPKIIKYKLVGG